MIIGLDTGGTHVDAVIVDRGKIMNTVKLPTDRSNLFKSIWETLELLLKEINNVDDIKKINLSTTVSTNAIIENKTEQVAVFIESGPGINPENFKCGDHTVFLDGYIDHRGREVKSLNKNQIYNEIKKIHKRNILSAAVISKFSTRNPSHEKAVKTILKNEGFNPITSGHSLSGSLNFPRRIYTTYLNTSIYNTYYDFSIAIKKALKQKALKIPINILKADGGTMSLDESINYPVQTILSGPAASVMGCLSSFNIKTDALLFDIGGTTTDISFLANGAPLFIPDGIKIRNYPTLVRSLHNTSIGLGGDSCIRVNDSGEISIGPNREGHPMALDGPMPTPSDAMIVLGKLDFGDKEKALSAMSIIGNKLGIDAIQAAKTVYESFGQILKMEVDKILEDINSKPVYTIHELLYGKNLKPKKIIAIGGPAKASSEIIEKTFNIPCHIPHKYEVANAVGAALTKTTSQINLIADTEQGTLSIPEINIYKSISKNYTLNNAKNDAVNLLKQYMKNNYDKDYNYDIEITDESSFNMVRGFLTTGKNIRVKAQVKPGLISKLGGIKQ